MSDAPRRLLFLTPDLPFFLSHRLPLARAARAAGYRVAVAAPPGPRTPELVAEGIEPLALRVTRGSLNPLSEMRTLWRMARVLREWRPDAVHLITSKSIVYGGALARVMRIPALAAMTGMGYVFTHDTPKVRLLRAGVVRLYRFALNHRRAHVLFQNGTDLAVARRYRLIARARHSIIPGSGTDLSRITPAPLPDGPPVAMLPARMLRDKGVAEFVEAARTLRAEGMAARFVLLGDPDPQNPTSLTAGDLTAWSEEGVVEWRPFTADVGAALAECHLVVLPSYREGFPKTLIDAAAAGRAAIASDVPGCRDAIVPDETGRLFEARSAGSLCDCLREMLGDRDRLERMGAAARRHAEAHFDIRDVCRAHLALYDDLTGLPDR